MSMQDCLSTGKPLPIENIEEELDPLLDPILEKQYIKQNQGNVLQLSDKEARLSLDEGDTHVSWRNTQAKVTLMMSHECLFI